MMYGMQLAQNHYEINLLLQTVFPQDRHYCRFWILDTRNMNLVNLHEFLTQAMLTPNNELTIVELIQFTGDIYENFEPLLLLPLYP